MKAKIVLGLAVGLLVSINASALEIYKGRLISHKESSTHNIKFTIENSTKRFGFLNKMVNAKDDSSSTFISMGTFMPYTSGSVNSITTVSGALGTFIQNNTSATQTYYYMGQVCAMGSDGKSDQCATMEDQVQLDPSGYASYQDTLSTEMMFTAAGTTQTVASTSVSGTDGTGSFSASVGFVGIS